MKYLIFSDLHGSKRGLELLEQAVSFERPDLLICLGDISYGAYDQEATIIGETIKRLEVPIVAVRGNCDYVEDESFLGFALPSALAIPVGNHEIRCSHKASHVAFPSGDFVFFGHTHVKTLYKDMGVTRLNPGSIALPRDGVPSYAVMDDEKIELVDANDNKRIQTLNLFSPY